MYTRIALVDDVLYYDLCNDSGELVRVASDSIGIVRHGEDTPMFQRSPNQSAQVTPDLGSGPDAIGEMCRLLRMDTLLFRVHLISFFRKCSRHLGMFCHLPAVDPVASQGNDPKRSNAPAISDYVVTSKLNGQIFVTCRSKY